MMKLRFDLYKKKSGKWQYGGEFELPDDIHIWDDIAIEMIANAQKEVLPQSIRNRQYHLVINEIEGESYPKGQFWMTMFPAL